jgi:hypothetical protein
MAARSVQINVFNNTDFSLTKITEHLCRATGGDPVWTPGGWEPPDTIAGRTSASWRSESAGVLTGVEGWVKYKVPTGDLATDHIDEQGYIHWDNPYVWDMNTNPYNCDVSVSNITPDCDPGDDNSGGFAAPSEDHRDPIFEIITVSVGSRPGDAWLDFAKDFGSVAFFGLVDDLPDAIKVGLQGTHDLVFGFALRQKGSVKQSLPINYDSSSGLRPLAKVAGTFSLRKLLAL